MRCVFLLSLLIPTLVVAQQSNYPPQFEDTREEVYKTIDGIELKLWVFEPPDLQPDDARAAIVFFFGGGWKKGDPGQFEQHCRYFAARGMVAMTADYRVLERHGTFADRSVSDAKSAIRFVRQHATRLGIDPNRIVAAGGSAGGHLAACTGVVVGFDQPGEDQTISSAPNAMALFNPALVLSPFQGVSLPAEKVEELSHRSGVPLERIAPVTYVRAGLPPTIIFHGTADDTVPFATVEKYAEVATAAGNQCELVGYRDATHGFFNYGRGGMPGDHYCRTVHRLDRFLASHGYVSGPPTMAIPDSENVHLRTQLDNSRIRFSKSGQGSVAFIGG